MLIRVPLCCSFQIRSYTQFGMKLRIQVPFVLNNFVFEKIRGLKTLPGRICPIHFGRLATGARKWCHYYLTDTAIVITRFRRDHSVSQPSRLRSA